jgi:hypothetical protein
MRVSIFMGLPAFNHSERNDVVRLSRLPLYELYMVKQKNSEAGVSKADEEDEADVADETARSGAGHKVYKRYFSPVY